MAGQHSATFVADWIAAPGEGGSPAAARVKTSSTSWETLGVSSELVRALITLRFKKPTPIQRAAIPVALAAPPRDILGMARTGSGKTLAYLIPLLMRLGSSTREGGTRGIIMCPSRELALQVLRAGKTLTRALGRSEAPLRWGLIMGGESLDTQFEVMSSKPDIVIATPGRLLHVLVEMGLDLRSVQTVIYDEADRLFEMGFELQLREILHRLPATRHSLLFSATLPSTVAEFAKAGLNNPEFIRLDTEHKISPDLRTAFISVRPVEKEAALLVLLRDAIGVPLSHSAHKTSARVIIFVSTKHHVDFVTSLLQAAQYRVSYIYGSLDQHARQQQLRMFRDGMAEVLVVTDVAARGLDIPAMGHVVNFDFPPGVRIFIHRVGRTARAGQTGNAWSLVTRDDMPYLRDLEAFLERPITSAAGGNFGTVPREALESAMEYIRDSLELANAELPALRQVMQRGQSMFVRSRSKASGAAYKASKDFLVDGDQVHPAFNVAADIVGDVGARSDLIAAIQAYRPSETIFEVGSRGGIPTATLMKQRRLAMSRRQQRTVVGEEPEGSAHPDPSASLKAPAASSHAKSYRDAQYFLPVENVETNKERGLGHSRGDVDDSYSLKDGASFAQQTRSATLDLNTDDGHTQRVQKASQLKWDRKRKRFIKEADQSEGKDKMIRGESGALLPASYKSGRYEEWTRQRRPKPTGGNSAAQNAKGDDLASAHSILRARREKEKKQQKNSRASKKSRRSG